MLTTAHLPVLYAETLAALAPRAGGRYIDGTLGAGGHAAGVLAASAPDGQLLGLDCDPVALNLAAQRLAEFGPRAHLIHASYEDMPQQAADLGWTQVDGILLDLGASSMQFDQPERGFSFMADGPLDMRFDPRNPRTADEIVNHWHETDLADIIYQYGEERQSRRIASAIIAARPITTTTQLAAVIKQAIGRFGDRRFAIHPATRTFQALRIAVNDELNVITHVLPAALRLLAPGGRLAVIAFHSLEDRIVKTGFRDAAQTNPGELHLLTRKPTMATNDELATNPRSRSARLRVIQRAPLA